MKKVDAILRTALCLGFFAGFCAEASDSKLPAYIGNSPGTVANIRQFNEPTGGSQWARHTSIPVTNGLAQTTTVASDDGIIYVIGGGLGAGPDLRINQVLAYSPATDSWSSVSPIPVPAGISAYGSAVQLNGFVYVFGGISDVGPAAFVLQSLWIYDILNDAWFSGRDMPAPRFGSAVGVIRGNIIVAGGGSMFIETTTWLYDPVADTYANLASMPDGMPTYRIHGVGLDARGSAGELHAFGGAFESRFHYIYDAGADSWSLGRPMQMSVTDPGVAAAGNKIYVTGGQVAPDAVRGELQTLDLVSDFWSEGPFMEGPLNNTSAAIANGQIYCEGGFDGITAVPFNQSTPISP